MTLTIKSSMLLLLTSLAITGCSSTPKAQGDSASMQKYKAEKAQKELAREVSKIK